MCGVREDLGQAGDVAFLRLRVFPLCVPGQDLSLSGQQPLCSEITKSHGSRLELFHIRSPLRQSWLLPG